MEIREKELTVLDRDADPDFYFASLSNETLLTIVNNLEDFEDVSNSLTELSKRNLKEIVTRQSLRILENNLGDQFLQATAFDLLYREDREKAMEIIKKRLSTVSVSLLSQIMSNLATDSSEPFGKSLSPGFLKSIVKRYADFSIDDKDLMAEDYEWFKEKYKSNSL